MKQKEKLELMDNAPLFLTDIKKSLQEVYNQFRAVKIRNEYLEEENARLKSEAYKDEELAKMKEDYDRMKKDYYRGFPISEAEHKKIREWIDDITKNEIPMKITAIGGRFAYEFIPTSIGLAATVSDSITGKKLQFKELG